MRRRLTLLLLALAAVPVTACGGDDTADRGTTTGEEEVDPTLVVESPGPHPVAHQRFTVEDVARGRVLPVEIWYPADESARSTAEAGQPIEDFATSPEQREQLVSLLAAAPDPGTRRVAHSAPTGAPAEGGAWPVVVFSHCFNCVRFSVFTLAERLASHGIAVVAPDHTGGTLFDELAGEAEPLGTEFLATRTADMRFVLDRVLDTNAPELPAEVRGRLDPAARWASSATASAASPQAWS